MSKMFSRVAGGEKLAAKLASIPAAVNKPVKQVIAVRALEVETDAKQSLLSGGKTGKYYKRGKGRVHQASAPGEAPASDKGRLVSSIHTIIHNDGLEADIGVFGKIVDDKGTPRNYARDNEFGTKKMKPRPFLFPALEKNKEKIKRTLNAAVRKALKEVAEGK